MTKRSAERECSQDRDGSMKPEEYQTEGFGTSSRAEVERTGAKQETTHRKLRRSAEREGSRDTASGAGLLVGTGIEAELMGMIVVITGTVSEIG
jgi:hypothetical protein